MTSNPWLDLPDQKPYVLACDLPLVTAFNATMATGNHKSREIRTELLPGPFEGNLNAPVVVLLQNPGFSEEDERFHNQEPYRTTIRQTLAGKAQHHFHASGGYDSPGHKWWARVTKALRTQAGNEAVARNLLAIEFMPYHSRNWAHSSLRLPSQQFGFSLVAAAMSRHALIVCVRGYDHWIGAVPNLYAYDALLKVKNPRCAHLSSKNIGNENFQTILQRLT